MRPFSDAPFPNEAGKFPCTSLSRALSLSARDKKGLTHCTASQPRTPPTGGSCHPWPCGRPSRPPWWGVIPTTTMVALSPSSLRKEGDPMVRHDETKASRRQSTHPLCRPHWPVPTARKVGRVTWENAARAGHRSQTIADGSEIAPHGDWTSGSLALALGCGSCGTSLAYRLPPFSAFPTCCFPLLLSHPGRLGDPRTLLPVLPGSARDFIVRLMAHPSVPSVSNPAHSTGEAAQHPIETAFASHESGPKGNETF